MKQLLLALILILALPSVVLANAAIDGATNDYRQTQSLPTLLTSTELEAVAEHRVQEIVHVFEHVPLIPRLEGCWESVGENIAWSSYPEAEDPAYFVDLWIESPPHHNNIVGNWTHQASAIFYSEPRWYAVQIFARACGGIQLLPNTATSCIPANDINPIIFTLALLGGMLAAIYHRTSSALEKRRILCNNCVMCKFNEQGRS